MRLFIIILLGISLVLSIIGTITNKWYLSSSNGLSEGLWLSCQTISSSSNSSSVKIISCDKQPYFKSQGLSISGIILLSIAFVLSIIYFNRPNDRLLAYFIVLILLGTTLLLMFSYLLYPKNINLRQLGYSIYFMLISSLIVLITTGLVTFSARTIQLTTTTTTHLT
jgi:hypothetical protein